MSMPEEKEKKRTKLKKGRESREKENGDARRKDEVCSSRRYH